MRTCSVAMRCHDPAGQSEFLGLPPIAQPPEENYYDCFYACKPVVRLRWVRVRISCKVRFTRAG